MLLLLMFSNLYIWVVFCRWKNLHKRGFNLYIIQDINTGTFINTFHSLDLEIRFRIRLENRVWTDFKHKRILRTNESDTSSISFLVSVSRTVNLNIVWSGPGKLDDIYMLGMLVLIICWIFPYWFSVWMRLSYAVLEYVHTSCTITSCAGIGL